MSLQYLQHRGRLRLVLHLAICLARCEAWRTGEDRSSPALSRNCSLGTLSHASLLRPAFFAGLARCAGWSSEKAR
jgi:hypothetical protein